MTIKNFTFFSPNGTEFPVGSNNDGKLYMMLTGLEYNSIRRKDWSSTLRTALNIQYVNTSIVAGGRYFELINETVALQANATNYIHANIDLTQTTKPVSLSAESTDNGNAIDLNNSSGVFKVVIDIVTTDGQGVIVTKTPKRVTVLDEVKANSVKVGDLNLYPGYSEGQWIVEQIQSGLYRLTAFVVTTGDVTQNFGQVKMGPNVGEPALPSGFTKIHASVSVAEGNKNIWLMRDGVGVRLMSGTNQTGVNNTIKFEIIATKN